MGRISITAISPYILNLCLALMTWAIWFCYTSPDSWALIQSHWQVSVTMIFGSIIAGATSEGGGAIAFPVFTKVLQIPPADAKVFSLAIQSVGMVAASIAILMMRVKVLWPVIAWVSLGGGFGLVVGAGCLSALLPANIIRMLFTVMAVSLALTLLCLNAGFRSNNLALPKIGHREIKVLLLLGFLGGVLSGLVGSGIDMLCFSVLVLWFRISESIATPTSVILMAIQSLFGILLQLFVFQGVNEQVQAYWLAAVPVVVVGAPLGAFLCTRMAPLSIRYVLIFLIAIELCSSVWILNFDMTLLVFSVCLLGLFSGLMFWMSKSAIYVREIN